MSDDILQPRSTQRPVGPHINLKAKAMWTQLFQLSVQFRARVLQVRTKPKAELLYPITCKTRYTYHRQQ